MRLGIGLVDDLQMLLQKLFAGGFVASFKPWENMIIFSAEGGDSIKVAFFSFPLF